MVTINTDDPIICGTNLTNEYRILVKEFGFSFIDLKNIIHNGLLASFLPIKRKIFYSKL